MKTAGWFKAIGLAVLLLVSSLTLIVLGLIIAELRVQHAEQELRAEFLRRATEIASSINPLDVATLSFRSPDKNLPSFDRIIEQFSAYSQEYPDFDIYSLKRRGNALVYGPSFFVTGAPSPAPGSPYPSSSIELAALLSAGGRIIESPAENYITAMSPVFDPKSDEILMTVALDKPMERWQEELQQIRLVPVAVSLFLLALLFFGVGIIYLRRSIAPNRLRHLETLLVALFGLLLTGAVTLFVLETEDRSRRLAFMRIAESKADAVETSLRSLQQQMGNISAYIGNVKPLKADAFSAFSASFFDSLIVRSCFWVVRLAADERNTLETRAREEEGLDDYQIFQLNEYGERIDVEDVRAVLYPVFYVESSGAGTVSPGHELGSMPAERIALEAAAQTGLATASIPDMEEIINSPTKTIYIYAPVYENLVRSQKQIENAQGGTVDAIRGFIGVELRFDLLLQQVLSAADLDSASISIKLFQLLAGSELLPIAQETGKAYGALAPPAYSTYLRDEQQVLRHSMFALSHTYALLLEPTPHFFAAHPTRNVYAVALIAFFITLVFTVLVGVLRGQQLALEGRIWESTVELRESSETFRRLFSESTDPILLLREGKIYDCNNSTLRLLKYTSQKQLLERRPEEISPPKQPDGRPSPYAFKEMVGLCVRNGHHAFEWTHLRSDGTMVPVETMFTLITIRSEKYIHVAWRDITERKLAEEALRSSEEKYRTLVDSLPIGLYRYTAVPEERFVMVNRAMVKIHGSRSVEELMAQRVADLYVKAEDRQELWRELGAKGFVAGYEVQLKRRDGSIIWGSISGRVLQNAKGIIEYFDGSLMDITERKRAAEERMEMERRLLHSQKLESLGVLAGGIAHDFNNLLAIVLGNLEVAEDEIREVPAAHECVSKAVTAARRAAALTDQMLAYSGKGRFVVKAIDLSVEVEENLHILRASISKNANLDLRLTEGLPPIYADAGQIQQIVMNLITNASEAIGNNTGTIIISTGVAYCTEADLQRSFIDEKPEPGNFIYLEIRDTGCGMDEATRKRVFDPFFSTKFTGRGLGMSAVLGIMQGHKGALEIHSRLGKGTLVRVLFPVAEAPEDLPEVVVESEAESSQPAADKTKQDIWGGTFLVVDDEAPLRELGEKVLSRFGFDTITACDGQEAVEIFSKRADEITAVLLDLTMPRLDGVAAFEAMRKIKPDIKVILCSGFSEHEAKHRFSGQGLAGYVHKPYRITTLREEIEKVMRGEGSMT